MKTRTIQGDALTAQDVHQQVFSYNYEGSTIDINGELYYNKRMQRFEHWHDDDTLVVWNWEF